MTTPQKDHSANTWIVWLLLGLVVAVIVAAFIRQERQRAAGPDLPVIATVGDFGLTNQLGEAVTREDLRGTVWVASVIFTRCPGPCLTLSRKFAAMQDRLPKDGTVRLVSLTVDPEFDTPEVLGRYARKLGADPDRWWFLTGEKAELRRLAIRDLQFVVMDKEAAQQENEDDLFIHSTYFMVVDKRGRVRRIIDTLENPEMMGGTESPIEQTLATIEQLLNQP